MNTYAKYCPNVFLAKCTEKHERGEMIELTTKYGKTHECEVWNLVHEAGGFYYYSITRADGTNAQTRAQAKADRLKQWAENAEKRSQRYYEASHEGADFLALGEPIKVGHHSEKRHRALIERNWNRMGKSVEEGKKAEEYESRAEYWEARAEKINLSMPESIEYYAYELEKAQEYHRAMKAGEIERAHSMSMQYANKKVKDLEKLAQSAKRLWGE